MTLENINQQVKDLVYNLLNNGDSYITHCNNHSINYVINNKVVSIIVRRSTHENKEYKLNISQGLWSRMIDDNSYFFNSAEDPICFEVCVSTRYYYYYPEDRVQEATLLDLMEQKAANYLYNNLVSVNSILSRETEDIE